MAATSTKGVLPLVADKALAINTPHLHRLCNATACKTHIDTLYPSLSSWCVSCACTGEHKRHPRFTHPRCVCVRFHVRTWDTEGLLSRPLRVRLSRPFRDEKRPRLRCRDASVTELLLRRRRSVASSLEQIWSGSTAFKSVTVSQTLLLNE